MAQYTSYQKERGFSALQFADDSERILRQADDLIRKQTLLGEYRSKQATALATNLNIEFERSRIQRDENFRRRQEQQEINFRIKEREGQEELQVAQQQARLDDAFKEQQDARRMDAIAGFAKAASSIGTAVVKDQVAKAQEAGEADGAADAAAQLQRDAETNNALDTLNNANPPSPAETVGQTVRDSLTDTATVASANQDRIDTLNERDQFNNPLQKLFGIHRQYTNAQTKGRNQFLADNFNNFLNIQAQEQSTPVTVNLEGVEQEVMFGDARLYRDPKAYQDAMTQMSLLYTRQNGIDKQDPVVNTAYYKKVTGVMNERVNNSFKLLRADNLVKENEINNVSFTTSDRTVDNLDSYFNKSISLNGRAQAYNEVTELANAGAIPLETFNNWVDDRSAGLENATISESNPEWVAQTRKTIYSGEKSAKEEAESMLADKLIGEAQAEIDSTFQDGYGTQADMGVIYTDILARNPNLADGVKTQLLQSLNDEFTTKNKLSKSETIANLDVLASQNELTVDDVRRNAQILGEDAATYYERLGVGADQPLPEGIKNEDRDRELKGMLTTKLSLDHSMPGSRASDTIYPALRQLKKDFNRQYRKYSDDGLSPNKAYGQAMYDLKQLITNAGEGDTYGVIEGYKTGGSSVFGSFAPSNNPAWQPKSNAIELNKKIEAVTSGTQSLDQTAFISSAEATTLDSQLQNGKPLDIPGYVYPLAKRLRVSPEELLESQLKLYGKDASLGGPTPITRINENVVDPKLSSYLQSRPTQAAVNTTIAVAGNYPAKFGSGASGYEQVKAAAFTAGGQFPELTGAMWAVATNYGTTEAYITDDSGNKMAAGSPKEYVDWANNQIQLQISEGGLNTNMTYRELIEGGALPRTMLPVLNNSGLLDSKPGSRRSMPGSTPTTDLTVAYVTGSMTFGVESTAGEHLHVNWEDNPNTPENESDSYIDQHSQMMNDSILIETGKGTGKYLKPSEWETFTAQQGYPTTAVQRHGASRDGGARQHGGFDFRSEAGSKIKLRNGARIIKVIRGTQNGDHVIVQFKDGSRLRMLHGKFSGVQY